MSSLFGTAWRGAYPQLERSFGEPSGFVLQPMTRAADVNGVGVPDPVRAEVTFTGIFDAEAAVTSLEGRGRAGSWAEHVVSTQPQIDVAENAFPSRPRTGDRLLRLATGARYVVSEVRASDLGRLVLRLNRA